MKQNQKGFTIVEIMLAMAVFSFVLLIIVVAFTQILQTYRAGVSSQKTQEASREIITQMTRDSHTAKSVETSTDGDGNLSVCFDKKQYKFVQANIQYSNGVTNCGDILIGQKLVSSQLQILVFEPRVAKTADGSNVLGIDLRLIVATNSNDLLNDSRTACDPAASGSQYCSTTEALTSIGLRGGTQ